ncbi:hypothetical protein [Paraburkholderia diazotrophica]|uniref:Uncharacterized protein n=1 Tax=Paraburkholderia diazotrophica TaxID=667676 RepID=A0A1H7EBC9_9BURK|nr:hypothetical protein [Paraburkholderia diazotrophica]SEK10944.1 hypothetical protein SAMN05192539_104953 [Paraburkholderia diazotrophica]
MMRIDPSALRVRWALNLNSPAAIAASSEGGSSLNMGNNDSQPMYSGSETSACANPKFADVVNVCRSKGKTEQMLAVYANAKRSNDGHHGFSRPDKSHHQRLADRTTPFIDRFPGLRKNEQFTRCNGCHREDMASRKRPSGSVV